MTESYKDKLWLIILWIIFGGILVSLLFYSQSKEFDKDELEHIHTAWKILQGQEIYIDFFQHHHPFFNYLLVPVIDNVGSTVDSILASRYLMLFMMICIIAITYFLSLRIFKNSEIGVISIILTSTVVTFYMKSVEIRPDVPQALTGLISTYLLFTYFDKKSLKMFVGSSIFLAISFLILQKSMVLIISIGALLLYDLYKKQIRLKLVVLYSSIFLMCILPYYIYMLLNGSFEQYYIMNWAVNLHIPQHISKTQSLHLTFIENIITIVLYIIGILTLLRSGIERRFAILSLLLLILPLIVFTNLWRQYFIPAIPILAIIASFALYSFFNKKWIRLVVLIGAIYFPMAIMQNNAFFNMNKRKQVNQIDKINYVLSITNEQDKVYDGNILFNVFRDDIDYFWFCSDCATAYHSLEDYKYNIHDMISTRKPKVISTYRINTNDRRIKYNYRASDKYPDLLIRQD